MFFSTTFKTGVYSSCYTKSDFEEKSDFLHFLTFDDPSSHAFSFFSNSLNQVQSEIFSLSKIISVKSFSLPFLEELFLSVHSAVV